MEAEDREALRVELAKTAAPLRRLRSRWEKAVASWRADQRRLEEQQQRGVDAIQIKRSAADAIGADVAVAANARTRLLVEFVDPDLRRREGAAAYEVRRIKLSLKRADLDASGLRRAIENSRGLDKETLESENERLCTFEAVAAEIAQDLEKARAAHALLEAEQRAAYERVCHLD